MDGFFKRRASQFKRMMRVPQELMRMQVMRFALHSHIVLIKMDIPPVPAELIFNTAESSFSD
jgi:hypothetical protein